MMDSSPLLESSVFPKELSIFRLILITFLQLGLGVVQDSSVVITLPYEIQELFPTRPALTLGILTATSSVCFMILSPIAGFYSDRCTSSWGRRRPFIAMGALQIIVGVIGCWMSSSANFALGYVYAASFFVMQLGVVVVNSALTALIPDLVPPSQRGVVSGLIGVMSILGSAIGYATVGAALPIDKSSLSYLVLLVVTVLSTAVALVSSNETPLSYAQRARLEAEAPTFRAVISQMLSGLKHRDFALVLIGRVLYYMSTAPEAFLLYLTDDLTPSKNPELSVTILVLTVEITALFVAIPCGKLSDKFGRKIFLYAGSAMVILTFQLFVMSSTLYIYYALGIIYGIGNGMYYTVEMALGMDCLPPEENSTPMSEDQVDHRSQSSAAGRNMGLWGTAEYIGSLIGLYMFAPLLQFVGGTGHKDHYTRTGYLVIFTMGSVFSALSALMVYFIKTKPHKPQTTINVNE